MARLTVALRSPKWGTLKPADAGATCFHRLYSRIPTHFTSSRAVFLVEEGAHAPLPDKNCLCQVEIHRANLAQTSAMPLRLGDSGNDCLEYTLGLSPKGRTVADRLCLISPLPSHSFSQDILLYEVFAYHAYLQFFPCHQTNKVSTDIESRVLTNTFSLIPMACPSPVSTSSLFSQACCIL